MNPLTGKEKNRFITVQGFDDGAETTGELSSCNLSRVFLWDSLNWEQFSVCGAQREIKHALALRWHTLRLRLIVPHSLVPYKQWATGSLRKQLIFCHRSSVPNCWDTTEIHMETLVCSHCGQINRDSHRRKFSLVLWLCSAEDKKSLETWDCWNATTHTNTRGGRRQWETEGRHGHKEEQSLQNKTAVNTGRWTPGSPWTTTKRARMKQETTFSKQQKGAGVRAALRSCDVGIIRTWKNPPERLFTSERHRGLIS